MKSTRSVTPRRARPVIGHPTYLSPRYHTKRWGRATFALLILMLGAVFGVGGGLYWLLHHPQGGSDAKVTVHVGAGDSASTIADKLHARGVLGNTLLFRLDARLQGLAGKLKVGNYQLRRNMSIDGMIGALSVYHPPATVKLVLLEGWRAEEMAAQMQAVGLKGRQFLNAVQHPDPALRKIPVLRDLPAGKSLEGYLFPDTYRIIRSASGKDIVRQLVTTLNQQFPPSTQREAVRHGWTIFHLLTLASIVEREARVPQERGLVASVYLNRLNDKTTAWKLNSDPTIQYVVGRPGKWWPVLQANPSTIAPASPYNTYVRTGLPPGPIANPGIASIMATVHPATTRYFYFVAKNDCRHQAFAATYAEQLTNQQKYHCAA